MCKLTHSRCLERCSVPVHTVVLTACSSRALSEKPPEVCFSQHSGNVGTGPTPGLIVLIQFLEYPTLVWCSLVLGTRVRVRD